MHKRPLELYFHIPFCVKKCDYCDFLSAPAGEQDREAYMSALIQETIQRAPEYQAYKVVSVFIGGGTPSVVEKEQIAGLLDQVHRLYDVSPDAEVTIEVNPGTVDLEKLTGYRQAGINRLSIGLQTANDAELQAIGRIHTWQQFLDTYRAAAAVGFTNINVDLMSALPGQTLESYRSSVQKVLALRPAPTHISAYSLILEEGTRLYEAVEKGSVVLPGEETDRLMYEETDRLLSEAGFVRYEISNYAKAGYECRHNCGYWTRTEYAGFGIGAASLISNVRFSNAADIREYIAHPLRVRGEEERLSREEQMEEFMFLGLRLTKGIEVRTFEELFGVALPAVYGEVIAKNLADGLLCYTNDGKSLALTKKGLDLSNYVYAQFLIS